LDGLGFGQVHELVERKMDERVGLAPATLCPPSLESLQCIGKMLGLVPMVKAVAISNVGQGGADNQLAGLQRRGCHGQASPIR
jgi:hypothetical protein